ncbi:MAG: hypothetical protein E7Z89_07085 [Cyanobacteria bacterium SIG28]|nr:hypothetical protein [Cyanobacteria bacterium SIG28]
MKNYLSFEDLLTALGLSESSGNYGAVNKFNYLGKYQMGEEALSDAGYYKKNALNSSKNNTWNGQFTGKDGVYSKNDFLNNHQAQENAIREYMKKQWQYAKHFGHDKYIGKKINGIEITPSGLLAGMHLKGVGGVNDYLKNNGKVTVADGYGTDVSKYLKNFANYDVTEITDSNYYGPNLNRSKTEAMDKYLNNGNNLIKGVTAKVNPPEPLSNDFVKTTPVPPPLSREEWLKKIRRERMGISW